MTDKAAICKSLFLTRVAKDGILNTYGADVVNWPPENFWALVSTIKSKFTDEQLSKFLTGYGLTQLSDFKPTEGQLL